MTTLQRIAAPFQGQLFEDFIIHLDYETKTKIQESLDTEVRDTVYFTVIWSPQPLQLNTATLHDEGCKIPDQFLKTDDLITTLLFLAMHLSQTPEANPELLNLIKAIVYSQIPDKHNIDWMN